jgi:tripartite-type tricarboxylate transporter receptor subunit TctC
MRTLSALLLATILAAFGHGGAFAADPYPVSQIKIIVPFPPGGSTDILARELGHQMATRLGVVVITDNRPGASGIIGSEVVAKSAPDGGTFLLTATHHVINPSLYKNLPYDPRKDFTSIGLVASMPIGLAVNPQFPAKTVGELIAVAKQQPGKLFFASGAIGGGNHLSGELFKFMTGIDLDHVPYKGSAPALSDLIGGHIPIMFDVVGSLLPNAQDGKLRILAVTTLHRVPSLPDVPTIDESGVKGFDSSAWYGLYAAAKMSPQLEARLDRVVSESLASPEIQKSFAALVAEPGHLVGKPFAAYVDAELNKWQQVIERAQIKLE